MLELRKSPSLNRDLRRMLVISAVLAIAMPMAPVPLGTAVSAAGQGRGTIRERIKERRAQRGQKEKQTAEETLQIAGLNVGVWKPSQRTAAPLIVFSHGFSGCHTQSVFLMEAMADAGYLVVAPDHKDAGCGDRSRAGRPEEKFGQADNWSDKTYADRGNDIKRLVEALREDREWASQVDWSRVGLVGHSLAATRCWGWPEGGPAGGCQGSRPSSPCRPIASPSP